MWAIVTQSQWVCLLHRVASEVLSIQSVCCKLLYALYKCLAIGQKQALLVRWASPVAYAMAWASHWIILYRCMVGTFVVGGWAELQAVQKVVWTDWLHWGGQGRILFRWYWRLYVGCKSHQLCVSWLPGIQVGWRGPGSLRHSWRAGIYSTSMLPQLCSVTSGLAVHG